MKSVYLLQHSYEYILEEGVTSEETKIIGIYSTRAKAEETIKNIKIFLDLKTFLKIVFIWMNMF